MQRLESPTAPRVTVVQVEDGTTESEEGSEAERIALGAIAESFRCKNIFLEFFVENSNAFLPHFF